VKELLERYPATTESMLDILHDLQNAEPKNYLKPEVLRAVAEYLSVPLSEVVSTATFYSMYSLKPRGRHVIRLCESPPCQLVGAESLLDILSRHLGIQAGETTDDGMFTLETASCLGVCGVAPAMMIDSELYGNLTAARVVEVIDELRRRHATG
jgi:NADH-quinone oxidoreductase subunit E